MTSHSVDYGCFAAIYTTVPGSIVIAIFEGARSIFSVMDNLFFVLNVRNWLFVGFAGEPIARHRRLMLLLTASSR